MGCSIGGAQLLVPANSWFEHEAELIGQEVSSYDGVLSTGNLADEIHDFVSQKDTLNTKFSWPALNFLEDLAATLKTKKVLPKTSVPLLDTYTASDFFDKTRHVPKLGINVVRFDRQQFLPLRINEDIKKLTFSFLVS